MGNLKNLTPHDVVINGKVFCSEGVLRATSETHKDVGTFEGVPISKTKFGKVENLPEKKEGTIYIVSSIVCQACPDRDDFYVPNESIRDDAGKIIGCASLAQNPFLRKKRFFLYYDDHYLSGYYATREEVQEICRKSSDYDYIEVENEN